MSETAFRSPSTAHRYVVPLRGGAEGPGAGAAPGRPGARPVRRQLADAPAAIVVAERLDPLRAVGGEILLREPAGGGDRARDLARVEAVGPALRDPPPRRAQLGPAGG